MTTCQICYHDYSTFHKHCPACGCGKIFRRYYDVANWRNLVRAIGAESVLPHSYPLRAYAVSQACRAAE